MIDSSPAKRTPEEQHRDMLVAFLVAVATAIRDSKGDFRFATKDQDDLIELLIRVQERIDASKITDMSRRRHLSLAWSA